ncbi:MAG: hypothetical protein R2941_04670 [Desulfobacterales bacterium]
MTLHFSADEDHLETGEHLFQTPETVNAKDRFEIRASRFMLNWFPLARLIRISRAV